MHRRQFTQPRGFTIIYGSIVLFAMLGMVSLAVDWGRVQTAKTELQDAVDAAARYASYGISDGTAAAKAIAAAGENKVDGTAFVLSSGDVTVGTWDSVNRVFTSGGSSPNAVRVATGRTTAKGNPLRLTFGSIVGRSTVDINATSIAMATSSGATCDVVGLNSVALSGSGKIQRLSTESGTVNVGSNGTYSLTWGQQIVGNAYYRNTAPSYPNGANCITGTQTQMSSNIAYTTPTTPGGCTPLGNVTFGNGQTSSVGGGNYSAGTVNINGGATVNLTGNVNIYCSGAVDVSNGAIINTSNGTYKLTFYQTAASTINFNIGTIYLRVYAPLSDVTVVGSTVLNGSVVCKNLTVQSVINYSSALASPIASTGGGAGSGGIATVK